MKVIIHSEDHKGGHEVDWPALPPIGAWVRFDHRGGTSNLQVNRIDFSVTTDGAFDHAEVYLTY
ncbi:hypothetical protein [Sphingomonas carotinifaciens]|uniref:hypothetical protein n=1 Tax=Sphingomonas carotinifaciens TaxID=1166323 RepID=UPI000DDAE684|nr:hypothetical protein [Sphingomonas carotinifaciens]